MNSTGVRLIWPTSTDSSLRLPLLVHGVLKNGNPASLKVTLRRSDGTGPEFPGTPIDLKDNSAWAFLFTGHGLDLAQTYNLTVSHSRGGGRSDLGLLKRERIRLSRAYDSKEKPVYGGGITVHWPTNGVSAYTHSGLICYGTCPDNKPVTSATLEYLSSQTVYLGTIMDAGMPDFWLAYFSTPESGIHSVRLEAFNDDGSEVSTFTLY